MKLSTLRKLGGIAVIVGAVLFTLWTVCWTFCLPIAERMKDYSILVRNPNWVWVASLAFPGILLTIFGFTAIYSKIYKDTGILGFLGYVLASLAYVFQACQLSWEIFLYPAIVSHEASIALFRDRLLVAHPMFSLFSIIFDSALFLGVILLGAALIRSKDFPKAGGILFIAGAVIYGIGPMINIYVAIFGVLAFSAGCFILGGSLFKKASEE